jgi:uncharacterized membrane protein YeaQ/YmgE (transglycosylase-associated protein family)
LADQLLAKWNLFSERKILPLRALHGHSSPIEISRENCMLGQVSIYSVAVWVGVGLLCGWLETLREGAGNDRLIANIVVCVAGAATAGVVFKWINGELGPPSQAPFYSAFIGAAIAAVLISPILRRVPGIARK